MDNFPESEPGQETPAVSCAEKLRELVKQNEKEIFGRTGLNSSFLSKGNRYTVKLSFCNNDGSHLNARDWKSLVEHCSVYFSDLLKPDNDKTAGDNHSNLKMEFINRDPNDENNQTIIISTNDEI